VVPIYGCVDPAVHRPTDGTTGPSAALSYLGTYAADRQPALQTLFVEPARRRPLERFVIGGAQYPQDFPWMPNLFYIQHVPPGQHPAFYRAARLTLNVTRAPMARMGYCPSGRLFEAAACGAPIVSDPWEGLDRFFEPDREILVADSTAGVLEALKHSPEALDQLARNARDRVLAQHTAAQRAAEMEAAFDSVVPSLPVIASAAAPSASPGPTRI
jgi:spore maturation protein CgeB